MFEDNIKCACRNYVRKLIKLHITSPNNFNTQVYIINSFPYREI